jgi:spermidine/putrescine transport system ATP-binding protein
MKKVPKKDISRRVGEALELVQLTGMDDRKPKQLSGGQQQRVALARALVNHPEVLLLDEPLGALDLKLRKAMQYELKQIQQQLGITFIYVTHDQEEAMTMSDRIAVMNFGEVMQVGKPRQIYENPDNRFVADFIGETNFIDAIVSSTGDVAKLRIGQFEVLGTAGDRQITVDQQVTLAIRPEKINLFPTGPVEAQQALDLQEMAMLFGGSAPEGTVDMREYLALEKNNVILEGRIRHCTYIGTDTRFDVSIGEDGGADDAPQVIVRLQNYGSRYDVPFETGDSVYLHWVAENAQILTE